MRNRPSPAFIAGVLDALPADGAPISSRGVFLALGGMSTPAYIRIVLRELVLAGRVIGTGPAYQRVYRRIDPTADGGRMTKADAESSLDGLIHDEYPDVAR